MRDLEQRAADISETVPVSSRTIVPSIRSRFAIGKVRQPLRTFARP